MYLSISDKKILREVILSDGGWPYCLTIVSLCSSIIIVIPSIVPLYERKKKGKKKKKEKEKKIEYAAHALTLTRGDLASDLIPPLCHVYESKSRVQSLPPVLPKENDEEIGKGCSLGVAHELALGYFFTILWPKYSGVARRRHRYTLRVCATEHNRSQ